MKMKNGLYHKDVRWNEEFDIQAHNLINSKTVLSKHLLDAIRNNPKVSKRFSKGRVLEGVKRLNNEIYKPFEVLVENGVVTKAVYRLRHNKYNDICIVVKRGFVVTAWLNDRNDKHTTLNKDKYIN